MKRILIGATILAFSAFGAYAFHSGGVAECEGCHSMHSPTSPSFLLVGADQSSACLTCHENAADTGPSSYHVSTAGTLATGLPLQRTPGGDFGWLKKTYTWGGGSSEGAAKGHNIVASGYGYVADTRHGGIAPGGTFPNSQLGCQSCHDPHGKARRLDTGAIVATGAPIIGSGSYNNSTDPTPGLAVGVYRILYAGASPDQPSGATFTTAPVAVAPATYNRTEATTQTRVAYGGGTLTNSWGNWCGTCHADFNSTSTTEHHPVDLALGTDIALKYNTYVSSGIMTGTAATSYLSLVPFAEATQDYGVLKSHALNNNAAAAQTGPATGDAVTCLSCHRAHASGFDEMLRFYYTYEFMTKGGQYVGTDNPLVGTSGRGPTQAGGRLIADFQAAYYDRPATFTGPYNRVLCNKCHAQD